MRFATGPAACKTARSCIALVDGSRRARHLARRLTCSASVEDSIRDGPGILTDGWLAALRRRIRFKSGLTSCLMACLQSFGGWFKVGPASCLTARSWRFGGWFGRDGPAVLPGTLRDNCFTGKIRKRNTLTHQTLLGVGRSPKLLVLVGLTIRGDEVSCKWAGRFPTGLSSVCHQQATWHPLLSGEGS